MWARGRRLLALAPAALLLAGCSDGGESSPAQPSSSVPSSEVTPSAPAGVPGESAAAYDQALATMSAVLQEAGAEIVDAQEARDVPAARAGAQRMRDAIFAFDSEVRRLELSAVQPAVVELLAQDGAMLSRLDSLQEAFTTGQVAQRISRLPTDAYIAAFQAVADAIDAINAGHS